MTQGVESIQEDISQGDQGDSLSPISGLNDPLTDTDNGVPRPQSGWEDGSYVLGSSVGTVPGTICLYVPDAGDVPARAPGVYEGTLSSEGDYDNRICSTATAFIDRGPVRLTTITFGDPGIADIVEMNYEAHTLGGQGALVIPVAVNADGEVGQGAGGVNTFPRDNCVAVSADEFDFEGSFTVRTGF